MTLPTNLPLAAERSPDALDMEDEITERLSQLRSMLYVVCGEPGEGFRKLNDDIQDDYFWAAERKAGIRRHACHGLRGVR